MATILCVALAAALASSAVATNPATCGADMIMPGIGLGGDKGLVAEESVATMVQPPTIPNHSTHQALYALARPSLSR